MHTKSVQYTQCHMFLQCARAGVVLYKHTVCNKLSDRTQRHAASMVKANPIHTIQDCKFTYV